MIIVMLGPPGAGKGTQAARLAGETGMIHVSTGDVFREHLRSESPLGSAAKAYLERGELVPDEVVIGMVRQLVTPGPGAGYVLDGFPRTMPQATYLDDMMSELDPRGPAGLLAVKLEVPQEELIRRLTGRRVCRAQGHIYHIEAKPPAQEGICDIDGSPLYQRDDDSVQTAARRLEIYTLETGPVMSYYEADNRLIRVDGQGSRDDVAFRLSEVVRPVTG